MGKKEFSLGRGAASGVDVLKNTADSVISESAFNFQFIAPDKIIPNKMNSRFIQEDIEELARSIEDIGLQHNLVVLDQGDGAYRLISGERRYRAILHILEKNPEYKDFRAGIPCKVTRKMDSIKEEISLIRSNTDVRELKGEERRQAILRLLELYNIRKENGEISSANAELAKDLDISIRQIQKYAATTHLIPELEELLSQNKITLKDAGSYANLDEDSQKQIYGLYIHQGGPSDDELAEIKALKEEKENIKATFVEKIQMLTKERDELKQQIEDAKNIVDEKMDALESAPLTDIEQIIRDKTKAEEKIRTLSSKYKNLQEKHDELKRAMDRPVVIEPEKARQIRAQIKINAVLGSMDTEVDELDENTAELAESEELFNKMEIIMKRIERLYVICQRSRNKARQDMETEG